MQGPMQDKEDATTEETAADASSAGQEVNDTPAAETESETTAPEEQELDPWEALELEVAKWKDQAIRNAAELDNYRKRMAREKLDAVRYGNQSLLEEILPVLDNFNMGMQAAAQEKGSMLYTGMEMVNRQLNEFLKSQNVEEIPAEPGGEFDHNLHDALGAEPSAEIEAGKILRVVRKGYRIGERLLRPANVIVVAGDDDSADTEPPSESE